MKSAFLFLVMFMVSTLSRGQEVTWHTDINEALELANVEDKKLMLFFTGSDWCGWCKKLQNEVFFTSDFKAWSKEVILVELDFPKRIPQEERIRAQNQQLQSIFRVTGYPTVYFVNPVKMSDGKTNLKSLGRTGYVRGGAQKWLDIADNILNKTI